MSGAAAQRWPAGPVVLIGGSGRVGTMVLPHLAPDLRLTVYDPRPPRAAVPGVTHVAGDATDPARLAPVLAGADALVYMAMGPELRWRGPGSDPAAVGAHAQASVTGLGVALLAAAAAGVRHAVYASTMSVYREPRETYPDETVPPDATAGYGLLKRLGEEVCAAAVAEYGLSVVALRLCRPVPDRQWRRRRPAGAARYVATSAADTARALRAALAYRGHGFEAVAVNGDPAERRVPIGKAARLLGWRPEPTPSEGAGR